MYVKVYSCEQIKNGADLCPLRGYAVITDQATAFSLRQILLW